jgi:ubiquinone/menaquinone biosynthesis C-methylase UbiE
MLNDNKKPSQEKVWDKIAPLWNKHKIAPFGNDPDKSNIFDKFIDKKDKRILDLGCGSGRNFIALKEAGFKGDLYGIDFSEEMLKFAKLKADKIGFNVKLKKSKVSRIDFNDNYFDKVIYIATLHCIEKSSDREKSLKEIYRVLKPKGKVLITVWNKKSKRWKGALKEKYVGWNIEDKTEKKVLRYYYLYDFEELKEILEKIGFKIRLKNFTDVARNIIVIGEK